MGGGLVEGSKLVDFFRARFADAGIESLAKPYGCVATELSTGREIWLREGPVIDAVRASVALPGLFTPAQRDGQLLVDGGLVNPVPVSLCRAMGADFVIAVDLNWQLLGRRNRVSGRMKPPAAPKEGKGVVDAILGRFQWRNWLGNGQAEQADAPSMLDVLSTSLNIMQVRITQSRLAGEPADVVIRPRLSDIAAMDYHRGAAAITEGRRAAEQAVPQIQELLG